MRLNKIISVLAALSVMLTCVSVSAANVTSETDNEAASMAVSLLEELKVIYEQSEFAYSSSITRADFAVYAARTLGIDDKITDKATRYYVDTAQYDYAAYSVNTLVEKGILSVDDERLFRPSEAITFDEAVKIVVCMTGYRPVAEARGGYPGGYISTAASLKLTQGLSRGGVFSLNDAAILLYKALIVPQYTIESVKTDGDGFSYSYAKSEEQTLLYEAFGLSHTEGALTGFDGMNIAYDTTADEDEAVIDGKRYKVLNDIDLTDYLGSKVGALYNKDDEISYIYKKSGGEKVTEISIDDYVGFDGQKLTYSNDNRGNKTIDVSSASVLYNGSVPESKVKELFNTFESGSIRVIDYDGNGTNDAVVVNDNHAFVFKSMDKNNNILYSKITGQTPIDLDDYDKVIIKNTSGDRLTAEVIEEDNVLNIAAAVDKSRLVITVSGGKASGTVKSMKNDSHSYISIDSTEYRVNKRHTTIYDSVKVGTPVTALLNIYGEIVYIISGAASDYNIGFLCGLSIDSSGFDSGIKFRIYSKTDGLATYESADSIKIDGIKYDSATKAINAIPECSAGGSGVTYKSQVILYKQDKDKQISAVDTYFVSSEENPDTTLCRTTDGGEKLSRYAGRFGRKNPIDSKTNIFIVPKEENIAGSDKSDYSVTQQGAFNINVACSGIECYKTKGDDEFCSTVVYRNTPTDFEENDWLNSSVFVVGELSEAIDAENENYIKVSGLYQGGDRSFNVYDNRLVAKSARLSDLDEGDLIRYRTGKDGYVVEIQKLYDAGTDSRINWSGDTDKESLFVPTFTLNFQLSFGYVNKRGNKVVSWGYKSGANVDEALDLSSAAIMFYDKNQKSGNRLYTGKIDSITDYQTAGDNCDIIIVHMNQTTVRSVTVYKK